MKRAAIVVFLLMVVAVFGSGRFHGSTAQAATPLPSGCYTDSSGLPVCGPDYLPSGAVPLASPPIKVTTASNISTISRLPSSVFDAVWDLGMVGNNSTDNSAKINANTSNPVGTNVGCAGLFANESYLLLPQGTISTTNLCRLSTHEGGVTNQRALVTIISSAQPSCNANFVIEGEANGFNCDMGAVFAPVQSVLNLGSFETPPPTKTYTSHPQLAQYYSIMSNYGGYQTYNNDGTKNSRSNITIMQLHPVNHGNGDFDAIKCDGTASGPAQSPSPGGSAIGNWNGIPNITCWSASVKATAAQQYLHPWGDNSCQDNGNDVTCVFASIHFDRTVAPVGTSYSVWEGLDFSQTAGAGNQSIPIDSYIKFAGITNIGLDASRINYLDSPTSSPIPVIAMKANDFIDLNCVNNSTTNEGDGPYSRYTVCHHTGIEFNNADNTVRIDIAATPVAKFTGTGLILPNLTSGQVCGTSTTVLASCGTSSSALYESTGRTSLALVSPQPSYAPLPCGSGATGSCSSGAITVTTGVSSGASGKWLVTVTESLQQSGTVGASTTGCVISASTFTPIDADSGNQATGGDCTGGGPTNHFMGIPNFGQTTTASSGSSARGVAHVLVANSTSFSATCYVQQSSVVAVTVYGWCSIQAVPI